MWRLSLALLAFFASAAPGPAVVLDPQPGFDESGPEVAVHPNGDVLLVWTRSPPELFEPTVMAATLDPDSGRLGELHEWGAGFATKVVPLGSGYLALRVYGPHLDTYPEAFVQRLDGDGQPVGAAQSLGQIYYWLDAHSTPDGGAVVVASGLTGTGSATQSLVNAWRFGPDGALLSGPAQLAGGNINAVLGADAAGNFVLAWRNERARVFARRFSPDLQPLSPVLPVASGTSYAIDVAVAPDGRFVVVYRKALSFLWARAYRADGSPAGKGSPLSPLANGVYQGGVDIAVGAQGKALVVWLAPVRGNVPAIQARVLSPSGLPLTRVFLLDRIRSFRGGLGAPRVERLPEGDFLVLWAHSGETGSLRFKRLSGR